MHVRVVIRFNAERRERVSRHTIPEESDHLLSGRFGLARIEQNHVAARPALAPKRLAFGARMRGAVRSEHTDHEECADAASAPSSIDIRQTHPCGAYPLPVATVLRRIRNTEHHVRYAAAASTRRADRLRAGACGPRIGAEARLRPPAGAVRIDARVHGTRTPLSAADGAAGLRSCRLSAGVAQQRPILVDRRQPRRTGPRLARRAAAHVCRQLRAPRRIAQACDTQRLAARTIGDNDAARVVVPCHNDEQERDENDAAQRATQPQRDAHQ